MHEPADLDLERMFSLDDTAGPARPLDGARATSLVEAALIGAGFPPAGPPGSGGSSGPSGGGLSAVRRLGAGKLGAIAGGTLAAVAAVALIATRGAPSPSKGSAQIAATTTSAESTGAPETSAPSTPPGSAAPTSAESTAPAAATVAAISAESAPAATSAESTAPPRRRSRAHHRPAPVTAAAEPEPPQAPADLLAAANTARADHAWKRADELYARVVDSRDALAAQTALVASASLHLEHLGDPRGASRRFRAALARGGAGALGALAEDARWGLAESARALDDTAAELRALDDFLAHHASSALAPRARTRRDALRGAP